MDPNVFIFWTLQKIVQAIASAQMDLGGSEGLDLCRLQQKLTKCGFDCKRYSGRPCMLRILMRAGYTLQIYPGGKVTIFKCATNRELISAFLTIHNSIFKLDFDSIRIQTSTFVGEYAFFNPTDRFYALKSNIGCFDGFTASHNAESFPQAVSLRCTPNKRLFANLFCSKKLVIMGPQSVQELSTILSSINTFLKHSFPNSLTQQLAVN